MASRNTTLPLTRAGDLSREWEDTFEWLDRAIERSTRGDFEARTRAAVIRLNALVILLTNSVSDVPEASYLQSVSLAAGNLGQSQTHG